MIRDLSQVEAPGLEVRTPLCIIGAGTAGIFLACQLRALGVDVLLLETGDRFARSANEMAQTCAQRASAIGAPSRAAASVWAVPRYSWGGQMIPLTAADMQARPAVGIDAWPIDHAELTNHLAHVKQRLGLRAGDDAGESALSARRYPGLSAFDPDFALRLSEWLPFGMRNFAQAFADPLRQDSGLVVWLNAGVVRLQCDAAEMGRILAVEARSANGRMLNVRPDLVVICAGALESTRLLLAFDESTSGRLTANGAPLGRYFADHLSVTCGLLLAVIGPATTMPLHQFFPAASCAPLGSR